MSHLRVIGHRGLRGLEVENTKGSLKKAMEAGADAVEVDVRMTADGVLVICHNRNLKKIYGLNKRIDEIAYEKLQSLRAKNGEKIPTLEEILMLKLDIPIIVDVKNKDSAVKIHELMTKSGQKWLVNTFLPSEVREFKRLEPKIFVSFGSFKHPRVVKIAKRLDADSITIPAYLLNPIIYRLAKKASLKVMIYQNYLPWLLTSVPIVRFLNWLYPEVVFISDRPDKIAPLLNQKKS